MISGTGYWDFDGKMLAFGLQHYNYKEAIKKYPTVRIAQNDSADQFDWCQKELGNNWIWSSPTNTNYSDIYFLNNDDALFFKLKFGTIEKEIAY